MGAESWIYCVKPAAAPPAAYDVDGKRRDQGVIWRMRVKAGERGDIGVANLGAATAIAFASNNPSVVADGDFQYRKVDGEWVVSIKGAKIGVTMINCGFTPPAGGLDRKFGLPAMPVPPSFGPLVLQVLVTRTDGSMPGDDSGIPPEGQMDAMACWAASLSWWTRAVPSATSRTQLSLIEAAGSNANPDGTLSAQVLLRFLASNASLRAQLVKPSRILDRIKSQQFPMIIGFASGPLGGHVNVIHKYDPAKDSVTVMEPWFPDPAKDSNYYLDTAGPMPVYMHKKTAEPFKFQGKHIERPVGYYTSRPLNGTFVVASSSDFAPLPTD